ncbi:glycoprotein hormone beta-5 [Sardina pilchardus]|uniref:glycoprotein hormone beta-5 n=1 Tax=Sardina pilchardus TaxID=27697 RepID=UPI002E0D920D
MNWTQTPVPAGISRLTSSSLPTSHASAAACPPLMPVQQLAHLSCQPDAAGATRRCRSHQTLQEPLDTNGHALDRSRQGRVRGGASMVYLRRFIGCAVREFSFLAKKPGCGGLHITTDACWGRCETWEKPVLEPPYMESYQRVCTYNETRQVTVHLPNCSAHVDPTYTYPVALRCDCAVCLTSTTECITSV